MSTPVHKGIMESVKDTLVGSIKGTGEILTTVVDTVSGTLVSTIKGTGAVGTALTSTVSDVLRGAITGTAQVGGDLGATAKGGGTDLMKVVLLANELCGAARDLLMMRDLVRAADGREGDQFLRLRLGQHAEMFDSLVGMVNHDLAWTKSAGMAATANRLKDQLRSTKALLERSRPQ